MGQPPHPSSEIDDVLDALKSCIDREFQLVERLTAKSRQAFAIALGFFTVIQTVALGSFRQGNIRAGWERHGVLGFAIAAIVSLAFAAYFVRKADLLVRSHDLRLRGEGPSLERLLNEAQQGKQDVRARLGGLYISVAQDNREGNNVRRKLYAQVRLAAAGAIVVTTAELIFSLVTRLD